MCAEVRGDYILVSSCNKYNTQAMGAVSWYLCWSVIVIAEAWWKNKNKSKL